MLKDKTPDTRDQIVWKWTKGAATTLGELGDPLGDDAYALCFYAPSDTLLSGSVIPSGGLCRGAPCWAALGGKGFKYVDKDGTSGGVAKASLVAGAAAKAKIVVKAKGGAVTLPALPVSLPLRVQLQGTNGQCWGATYEAAGQLENSAAQFKGKGN